MRPSSCQLSISPGAKGIKRLYDLWASDVQIHKVDDNLSCVPWMSDDTGLLRSRIESITQPQMPRICTVATMVPIPHQQLIFSTASGAGTETDLKRKKKGVRHIYSAQCLRVESTCRDFD